MSLYTIIMDYKGGTYVTQYSANGPVDALLSWIKTPDTEMLAAIKFNNKNGNWANELLKSIQDDPSNVVSLRGMQSIWYAYFLLDDELVGLNVVQTEVS